MADIVAKAVEIGLPYCVSGVKTQYRYLFRFSSFRDKLDKEVENLKAVQENMASRVQADRNNGRTIYPNVEKWLNGVSAILAEAHTLHDDMQNKKRSFLGRTCWYRLSKKFEKKTFEIIELREEEKSYEEVSLPRAHLPIPYISSNGFVLSKSSKTALDKIMEGLKDESIKVMGLYGMGGVGKTTLAEQVIQSVNDSKLFDKVTMVVVSETQDLMAIQDKVAAVLGLKFDVENDVRTKAGLLSLRLGKEKKVLIILDDVWDEIDLPKIGVTFTADQKGCKLLITTRFHRVCSLMNCNKEVGLDVMCETEAWDLFKKRAALNDASPIIDTAKEVARECGGLPIAIVPLARALVNNTPNQWKDALQCLRNSNLPGIKNIDDKNAYKCMKLSYDKLNGEEIKFCFLMCSLFPEDHEIESEFLVRYAWGLGVCKNADTIEEARIKVQSSIDHLKNYCLLINSGTNKVKMHDVVRHFALWIAFNEEKNFTVGYISRKSVINKSLETYMAISLITKGTQKLPSGLVCQNLKLLRLCGDDATIISKPFLEQMKTLKVLTIIGGLLSPYFPDILINLQVLCLEKFKVRNPRSLGNLKKLEILRFAGSSILVLPDEIGELKELKVLDLSNCKDLRRIPAGLIQKLSELEELYVTGSRFIPWEGMPGNTGQARLSELNTLSKLTVLSLDNIGKCLFHHSVVLPNLTRYHITNLPIYRDYATSKTIALNIDKVNGTSLSVFMRSFLTVEHLVMRNNAGLQCIAPETELGVLNNLNSLELSNWKQMICLMDTTRKKEMVFQNLKKLILFEMDSLKEVCRGQIPNEFLRKLESVSIKKCPNLCSIFQVQKELRKEDNFMLFSTLVDLEIIKLPELSCVWEGPTQHINLKCLTAVKIVKCRKLKYIFSLSMAQTLVHLQSLYIKDCDDLEHIIEEEEEIDLGSSTSMSHLIFTELVEVSISGCNKLKYIFPIFVAPSSLQQLKLLYLYENTALEQIFQYEEGNQMAIEWAHLATLKIEGSPNLVNFSGGYCTALSFPSLQNLSIKDCAIHFPPRLRLEGKQLGYVYLSKVPKEWGNYISSQLIIGHLPNLNTLDIHHLIGVEEVFRLEVEDKRSDIVLPVKSLRLNDLPQLAHICNLPSCISVLRNLSTLNISSCDKLSYIFSATLAQNLPMLKWIKVNDCKELVQVIGNDDQGVPNNLKLEGFPSLKEIEIKKCDKIKFVFPLCVASGLPNLQKLDVQDADGLEYVFGNKMLEAGKNSIEREEVVLPKLENIVLKELPSLRGFSVAGYKFIFPLIKRKYELEVGGCPNITDSFTLSATDGTTIRHENASLTKAALEKIFKYTKGNQKEHLAIRGSSNGSTFLQNLYIKDCAIQFPPRLEATQLWKVLSRLIIGDLPNLDDLSVESLIGVEELFRLEVDHQKLDLVLPIQHLNLTDLPQLAHICNSPSYTTILQNLTMLKISSCHKLSCIFSPTLAQNLPKLEWLKVDDCKELVQVIGNDNEAVQNHLKLEGFPSLKVISINDCNKIKFVFPPYFVGHIPNLNTLLISGCHKLSYIFPLTLAQNLPKLERLKVNDCKELVRVIGIDIEGVQNHLKLEGFPSLKWISIHECNTIKFVFPLSVVGGLPNLEKLDVEYADELEYIFGNETLEAGKNIVEKEEVVLSKLKNIVLKELPSLIGFSVAGYNIICPLIISETDLEVTGCPNFTQSFSISSTDGKTMHP